MKRRGISLPGWEPRRWEQTGNVYVYAIQGVKLSYVEETMATINDVINEFKLPLQTVNGNSIQREDTPLVESLITSNTEGNSIDCEKILEDLRRYWNNGVLRYGLAVLVNPDRYKFKNKPLDPEPACYGWTDD